MSVSAAPVARALASLALAPLCACAGLWREAPAPSADPATQRTTASGEVIGAAGFHGGHAWLGIPFAKPPVGPLRWRAPQPPDPWQGTLEAVSTGAPCTQFASVLGGVTDAEPGEIAGSEDCLYLNVYAPTFPERAVPVGEDRLPVMLWIHGGGNAIGHAGFYDGSHLASSQDVIVVTTQYRLGVFGWFRHPALHGADASARDRSGNYGTLDLIRALEWVRDHISAFGGDPGNVTIFGESAGGRNVIALLVSPLARGLFHRAIVQSGVTGVATVAEAENFHDEPEPGHEYSSREVILRLLVGDGTATDRAVAKAHLATLTDADLAAYLRDKTNREILGAFENRFSGMYPSPRLFGEGTVLPAREAPELFAKKDAYNEVPVILGTTRDETKLFQYVDPEQVRMWFGFFPQLRNAEAYELRAEYASKMWKAAGADELAITLRQTQGPSVWVYRFDWDEEPKILWADLGKLLGASHGFEIPFVFGHFELGRAGNVIFTDENEAGRVALSNAMMSYWAEFAYSGDPGRGRSGNLPHWAPWASSGADSPKYIVLDTEAGGGVRMGSRPVTKTSVLAELEADPRLVNLRARCTVLRELAVWPNRFSEEDYASRCEAFPLEDYPWEE